MKLLLVLISITIAVSPTKTTSGLQKRARFWKFGKRKATVAHSTSSVLRSVSLPTLTAMQSPADTTIIVAQVEQPYTLQTVTAVLDLAVTRAKLSTAPTIKSNSAGTVMATGFKPASTPGAIKNEIQAKETRKNAAAVLPSCSEEFLQGKVLNGKYKVGKMIGEGGFSAVFYGSYGNEVVALKCLIPTEGSNDNYNGEVLILSILDHPNLIKMLDTFVEGRLQFIVTEMCSSDLKALIRKRKKLELPSAKNIMKQIVDAIVYMHGRGIYHRDLKPENILLKSVDSLAVKVCDFGLSTYKKYSTEFVGTFLYFSPEILESDNEMINWAKNDVWGMGLIFFNLLTFRHPFRSPRIPDSNFPDFCMKKYGFSPQLALFFEHVFNRSDSRPSAKQFREWLENL